MRPKDSWFHVKIDGAVRELGTDAIEMAARSLKTHIKTETW